MNATTCSRAESSERDRSAGALSDRELSNVTGGKVKLQDFSFVHHYDKASPVLAH